MSTLTYDKNGKLVPSREFLNIMMIVFRKAHQETGTDLVSWLFSIAAASNIDIHDDNAMRSAIHSCADDNYPDLPSL